MSDNDRPQDVGRSHERKRKGGEDDPLLVRYQATMRAELGDLLDSLAPIEQDEGLGLVKMPPKRPPLSERTKIWDLAIKLGKELGSAIDPRPMDAPLTPEGGRSKPRARRVAYD